MDNKEKKKFYDVLIKLSNIFTTCYVFKTGTVIACDGKPFLIKLTEEQIKWFFDIMGGEFTILHIKDFKGFKKSIKENTEEYKDKYGTININRFVQRVAMKELELKSNYILQVENWYPFRLSENEEINIEKMIELFEKNSYIDFYPTDITGKEILLTKSFLPMVNQSNCNLLYYSSIELGDQLSMLIFDFHYELFEIYSLLYYIPIKSEKEGQTDD